MADEEAVEQTVEEVILSELESAPEVDVAPEGDIPPPPGDVPELEPLTPPHSWPQEHKDLFPQWPREAQEQLIRRQLDMEGDYTRTKQDLASQRRDLENRYNGLEQSIDPFRDDLTRRGLTPAQVVSQALSVEKMLTENPQKGLQWLAQRYGVQLGQQPQQGQPGQPGQPNAQARPDPQLTRMQQELFQLKQAQQQREQEMQQQQQAAFSAEVVRFADEVDGSGNLVRPYVREVIGEMDPFFSALKQSNPNLSNTELMEQAYQIAIQRNPDISTRLEQEAQLRRRQEMAQKVKAAEDAASSLDVPTNGVATEGRSKKNTVEQDIDLAMRELGS